MSTVISVENLGKKYTLRHQQQESYIALRDVIANGVASFGKKIFSPFTSSSSPVTNSQEDFWALKDVSFEVKQGDRIGIIGRNGAGKSTLLKILSRITEPTTGRVKIKGRVASLLEVGTGFHPELTGRENIYLNGAILGMHRAEIKKKFDEIVDFSEIEKFLDTPVKRYSSGMYVRLAFAVAAHLEPEILVVDEVLAVGDAQFQKKCLGKMEDVSAKEGRTVLFVSHNISAVNTLCERVLLLQNGSLDADGRSLDVTARYIEGILNEVPNLDGVFDLTNRDNSYNKGVPIITAICIYDHNKQPTNTLVTGKSAVIKFNLNMEFSLDIVDFGIGFFTTEGIRITSAATWSHKTTAEQETQSPKSVAFFVDSIPFTAGKVILSPSISSSKLGIFFDHAEMSCPIEIVDDLCHLDGGRISRNYGVVNISGNWCV